MSQIPFVNQLGDELERAAERAQPGRQRQWRRRRFGLLAVGAALLVSGSAIAGGLFSGEAEHQATASVACYDGADGEFDRSVAVVPPEAGSADVSPVALCRRELGLAGQEVRPMVACGTPASVAVIPGRSRAACAAAGFAPLNRDYPSARKRAASLERQILRIEASADCVAPDQMVRRVQRLLDRSRWIGWTARLRTDLGHGPCGSVSYLGGDGRRYISGLLDADSQQVSVSRSAPRPLMDLLYSADSSLLARLFDESGAQCFSFDGFVDRVRQVFDAHGVQVTVRRTTVPRGTELDDDDGRWTRYKAGCAVLAGGAPGSERDSVVIEIVQQP
jgi:hypothetical protein